MEFHSPSTKQWNYLTHSWELGLPRKGFIPEATGEVTLTETLSAEVEGAGP
jgi:hypothetical protein